MLPDQFLAGLQKNGPAPVYLFLGPEAYQRERCRRELIQAVLGDDPEERENGFSRHDLSEGSLSAALDDARAMSLFASKRLVWIGSAEAALPRSSKAAARAAAQEDDDDSESANDGDGLAAYLRAPTPGTVVVLESSR